MEKDSPLFGSFLPSSQELLLERLAFVGIPRECCSERGLVEFVRANQSMIPEIVSALLPIDEDVKEARQKFRKATMKKKLRESMNWLQWLMFHDEPSVSLKNLAVSSVDQRGVCGSVWGHNDIAYRCRTCENDPTCAICVPCFQNGNHSSHDYSIIYTGGGCCDCGDETAWKQEGFCSKHKGSEQIQPLSGDLANSVGPVLDALFSCWNKKLLSAESIKDDIVLRKMSNELTSVVVEMLLEFCKSSESLLSFVSRRIISSTGLLDILVKAERFLDQDVMEKLHDLFLKLIGDPVFKLEFAKAFVSYYPVVDWYKGIWFPYNTPRYSFMAWIAVQNRLPTGERILAWNTAASTSCSLCPEPLETRNHLFYKCKFSEEVWKNLAAKLLSQYYTDDWEEVVRLLTDQNWNSTRLFLIRYVFQATISAIWKERNGRRHGDRPNTPATLIKGVDKAVRNRISSLRIMGVHKYAKAMETWFSAR